MIVSADPTVAYCTLRICLYSACCSDACTGHVIVVHRLPRQHNTHPSQFWSMQISAAAVEHYADHVTLDRQLGSLQSPYLWIAFANDFGAIYPSSDSSGLSNG